MNKQEQINYYEIMRVDAMKRGKYEEAEKWRKLLEKALMTDK